MNHYVFIIQRQAYKIVFSKSVMRSVRRTLFRYYYVSVTAAGQRYLEDGSI